jgi:5-methylcytosine-specific restriction endonuclease McrBC GTP-binding regulatory subunit McrB
MEEKGKKTPTIKKRENQTTKQMRSSLNDIIGHMHFQGPSTEFSSKNNKKKMILVQTWRIRRRASGVIQVAPTCHEEKHRLQKLKKQLLHCTWWS